MHAYDSRVTDYPDLRVDDDGFVVLITPDTYVSFVDEDWTFDQITAHFAEQMTAGSMFAVYVGQGSGLEVIDELTYGPPAPGETAEHEASGVVEVGPDGLWLADYAQITTAAQFQGQSPITADFSTRLPVAPGRHEVRLQHLATDALHLTVTPAANAAHIEHHSVPWFEL